MNYTSLDTAEWQERLEVNFLNHQASLDKLIAIAQLEYEAFEKFNKDFVGHSRLTDSSLIFSLNTLQQTSTFKADNLGQHNAYSFIAIDMFMMLRKLRASSLLAGFGYHGPAYSLLRDIRDKSILLSACFQGKANYEDLAGVDLGIPKTATRTERRNRARKKRKSAEKAVFLDFLDFKEFATNERENLEIWKELFDMENHGSSMSAAAATQTWHIDRTPLVLVNTDDLSLKVSYINRFCEVSWMFHRLLPNLQTPASRFDGDWKRHWDILDHSFWQTQIGMKDIGKKIGEAIIQLVGSRFPFSSDGLR